MNLKTINFNINAGLFIILMLVAHDAYAVTLDAEGNVDFNSVLISGYAGSQDAGGTASIEANGAALNLVGNTWKKIPFAYTLTANTMIEFDFSSSIQGEIHGLGFDTDNSLSTAKIVQVYGTQPIGVRDFNNYDGSGGITHYTVPIGQYYTGNMNYLFLVNDHDRAPFNGESLFSNVRIYESGATGPGEFVFARSTYSIQEDQGMLEVEVRREQGSTGAVSVVYTTNRLGQGINPFAQDNDFSQPGDYDGTFNTLDFADGEVSQTFTVTIYDDLNDEGNETFGLKLLDPLGGARLGASSATSATVTIIDDERLDNSRPGEFVFARSTYNVQESQGTLEVEVRREQGSAGAVSVAYTTRRLGQGVNPFAQDNDFSQPGDYDGTFNTLNFADGEVSQTFSVTIYDDLNNEGNETFGLELLDPQGGAQLGRGSTTSVMVTIVDDDDPKPGEFVFARSTYNVQEDQGILEVEVRREQGSAGAVSVVYTTNRLGQGINPFAQDNDFSQPGDYEGTFNTLNFADGEVSQTFTVTIYDDLNNEGNETFELKLLDPLGGAQLGAGTATSATVTIIDNDNTTPPIDGAPPLSITNTSGALVKGGVITISGTGFGVKSPAAPLAWETFDNGVNGTRLSTDSNWPAYRQGGGRYSNVSPHSGNLSAFNRVEYDPASNAASSPFGFATNNYFFPKSDEIYYSYVYRQDGTSVGPAVQKLGRINTTGNLYNGLGVLALSDSYVLYQPGNNIKYPSDDDGSGRFFDNALLGRNTWTRHQIYGKLSQPSGSANGLIWVSVGNTIKTFANIVTRDQGETFQYDSVILGLMFANTNWEPGAVHDMYIDDVYIDNTLARVELCEGATWATRGVCQPQPPKSWSSSSIQVNTNLGEWSAGTTVYLYVVDAAGNAGTNGYKVLVSN